MKPYRADNHTHPFAETQSMHYNNQWTVVSWNTIIQQYFKYPKGKVCHTPY